MRSNELESCERRITFLKNSKSSFVIFDFKGTISESLFNPLINFEVVESEGFESCLKDDTI